MESNGALVITQFTCRWAITDFSSRREGPGEPMDSPIFSAGDGDQFKWLLRLYPKSDESNQDHLSLYLYLVNSPVTQTSRDIELSIQSSSGDKCHTHTFQKSFSLNEGHGYSKFISRALLFQNIQQLLPADALTICCRIKEAAVSSNGTGQSKTSQLEVSDDLSRLLLKPALSDVIFNVQGRQMYAHKVILIARSPVFAALFKSELVGHRQRVDVADTDPAVFEELLRFIYTGRVNQLEPMADRLLAAAAQYQLKQLKFACQQVLRRQLTIANVSRMLILADRHSADQLRSTAIEFINQHSTDVIKTAGWSSMIKSHPQLIASIYVDLLQVDRSCT